MTLPTSAVDLARLQAGGLDVADRLIAAFATDRGTHIESLLTCLGALAGYSCQASLHSTLADMDQGTPIEALVIATGVNGRRYFFGDALNRPLAEDSLSVWGQTSGIVQQLQKPLPDVTEIFRHVSSAIGSDAFGVPCVPAQHRPSDSPINYLKALWPQVLSVAKTFCNRPADLPILFGFAIQHVITTAKDVLDATMAATLVMESAIPMSKVDLRAES